MVKSVEEICRRKVEEKGYQLEYVEEVSENSRRTLRVVIDKKGSNLGADDCEIISRYIEDSIDEVMKDKEYVLEVSSAGLERQLKNIHLCKKYINSEIFIRLFKKTKFTDDFNEKEFEAKLEKVDEESNDIYLKLKNGEAIKINFKDIAVAHTVFDFDAFFKENK